MEDLKVVGQDYFGQMKVLINLNNLDEMLSNKPFVNSNKKLYPRFEEL
jgi:hypothetical protein